MRVACTSRRADSWIHLQCRKTGELRRPHIKYSSTSDFQRGWPLAGWRIRYTGTLLLESRTVVYSGDRQPSFEILCGAYVTVFKCGGPPYAAAVTIASNKQLFPKPRCRETCTVQQVGVTLAPKL